MSLQLFNFQAKSPQLKEYEVELRRFRNLEAKVSGERDQFRWKHGKMISIPNCFRFGTVLVSTVNFQKSLKDEVKQWINTITKAIHAR